METPTVQKDKRSISKTIVLTVLAVLVISLLVWHLLLPLLGVSIVITGGVWAVAVGTIALICTVSLLFFVFTGIGILLLGIGVLIWTVLAIVLFPFLFPILLPAVLLMFVIGYVLRK